MSHAVIEPTDELLDPTEIVPDHRNYINENDDELETSSLLKPTVSMNMDITELQSLPWYKRPSVWWMIIPSFITATSFAMLLAPMLQFYTQIFCNEYYHSRGVFFNATITDDIPYDQCQIPDVQVLVSNTQAIIHITTSVCGMHSFSLSSGNLLTIPINVLKPPHASSIPLALVVTGYYGALSDRLGRRFILRITALGSILELLMMILTQRYQDVVGIRLLFIGPVFKGLSGGMSTAIATNQAYISDCTKPSDRAVMFGRITAVFFVGGVLGPSLGSIILKTTGTPIITLFYILFSIEIFYFLYICFVIPESNRHLKKASQQLSKSLRERLNIFSALGILFRPQTYNIQATPYALPLLALLYFIAVFSLPYALFILYAMFRFQWTAYESGIYFSTVSAMRLVVLLGLLPLLVKWFKEKEGAPTQRGGYEQVAGEETEHQEAAEVVEGRRQRQQLRDFKFDVWLMRIGGGFEAAALLLQGLAPNTVAYFGGSTLAAIGSIFNPSIRSLFTNLVPPTQTGELLGAISFLDALAGILNPLVMNPIYSATVGTMPNLIFFLTSGLFAAITILSLLIKPSKKNRDQERMRL